jgi:hypothetical protein
MLYNFIPVLFIPLLLILTSPSTSTPVDSYLPPLESRHHQNRCETTHPLLTLHNITYSSSIIYSTPAHLAVAEGTVSFNLSNSAIPSTMHCSGFSNQIYSFFYGNIIYSCDSSTGNGDAEGTSAVFTFSDPDGTFAVNQTWACTDGKNHRK